MNFDLKMLIPIVAGFIIAGLFIAFGTMVVGDVRDDMVTNAAGCNSTTKIACGQDYNSSIEVLEGTTNISEKFPTLGTVVIAGVIITALLTFLAFRGR